MASPHPQKKSQTLAQTTQEQRKQTKQKQSEKQATRPPRHKPARATTPSEGMLTFDLCCRRRSSLAHLPPFATLPRPTQQLHCRGGKWSINKRFILRTGSNFSMSISVFLFSLSLPFLVSLIIFLKRKRQNQTLWITPFLKFISLSYRSLCFENVNDKKGNHLNKASQHWTQQPFSRHLPLDTFLSTPSPRPLTDPTRATSTTTPPTSYWYPPPSVAPSTPLAPRLQVPQYNQGQTEHSRRC